MGVVFHQKRFAKKLCGRDVCVGARSSKKRALCSAIHHTRVAGWCRKPLFLFCLCRELRRRERARLYRAGAP